MVEELLPKIEKEVQFQFVATVLVFVLRDAHVVSLLPPISFLIASTTMASSWKNAERHYCAVCNMWMGSDRQSIQLHESGKKHKEKEQAALEQRRKDKSKKDQKEAQVQAALKLMEASAMQSMGYAVPVVEAPPVVSSKPKQTQSTDKKDWESRKQKRQEDKEVKEEETASKKQRTIGPEEGHYTDGKRTFLEGPIFGDLLEEELPIQFWTGSALASDAEKRLLERDYLWRDGVVALVRKKGSVHKDEWVVDVAYLATPEATEETLETALPLNRIRILLGADEMIPSTLQEARIMAMGAEEVDVEPEQVEIDESTGLTGWATVKIKRTTVKAEVREERERIREKRREAIQEEERLRRDAEARKMEEAKVANADDSALGAYDVWGSGKGYKGVEIGTDACVGAHDAGKKLSEGKASVGFKKPAFKAKKGAKNRRRTTLDDD